MDWREKRRHISFLTMQKMHCLFMDRINKEPFWKMAPFFHAMLLAQRYFALLLQLLRACRPQCHLLVRFQQMEV